MRHEGPRSHRTTKRDGIFGEVVYDLVKELDAGFWRIR